MAISAVMSRGLERIGGRWNGTKEIMAGAAVHDHSCKCRSLMSS